MPAGGDLLEIDTLPQAASAAGEVEKVAEPESEVSNHPSTAGSAQESSESK